MNSIRTLNLTHRTLNLILKIVYNTCFPLTASAKSMRRRFDFLKGKSIKSLLKQNPNCQHEDVNIDGLEAEAYSFNANAEKIVLYLHGGGYFAGSLKSYRGIAVEWAKQHQVQVYLIQYRLAPECPFPSALDDALKAYHFLKKTHPGKKIILAGDSAGGGLALACTLALKDRSAQLPDLVVSICPWTDMTGRGDSVEYNQDKDIWLSKSHIKTWAKWVVGKEDPENSYLSPVFGDYSGFPKTLLAVGDQEVLYDDAFRVFEKLKGNGIDVVLHVGEDMQHNWLYAFPWIGESKKIVQAINDIIHDI